MLKTWEMGLPQPTEVQAAEMLNQIKKISEDNKRLVTEDEFKSIYTAMVKA